MSGNVDLWIYNGTRQAHDITTTLERTVPRYVLEPGHQVNMVGDQDAVVAIISHLSRYGLVEANPDDPAPPENCMSYRFGPLAGVPEAQRIDVAPVAPKEPQK